MMWLKMREKHGQHWDSIIFKSFESMSPSPSLSKQRTSAFLKSLVNEVNEVDEVEWSDVT